VESARTAELVANRAAPFALGLAVEVQVDYTGRSGPSVTDEVAHQGVDEVGVELYSFLVTGAIAGNATDRREWLE